MGVFIFLPSKDSVMVMCYDRLSGLLRQLGWSLPVSWRFLTSSGYGLLAILSRYGTCWGIPEKSSTMFWFFKDGSWWLCASWRLLVLCADTWWDGFLFFAFMFKLMCLFSAGKLLLIYTVFCLRSDHLCCFTYLL